MKLTLRNWWYALPFLCAVGCGTAPEAVFVLSDQSKELVRDAEKAVAGTLEEYFGTPHRLVAWQKLPADFGQPDTSGHAAGWKLLEGRHLYMRHCLHCHGVSGDGNGPTAPYLNPRPRDYRLGIFKFTSTAAGMKATRADLLRTLEEGIPGTSMPSFILLGKAELDLLVEYVRWLAMRGEFEKKLVGELSGDYSDQALRKRVEGGEKRDEVLKALKVYLEGEGGAEPEFAAIVRDVADSVVADWQAAEEEGAVVLPKIPRIDPAQDPETIARGRKLYLSEKAKCYTCHGLGGKGDGTSTVDYWPIPGSTPEKMFPDRGLHDVWGFPQKPRNLTLGQYRGGRRPVDLYRRVFAGIKGTQMAAFGGTVFNDQEMWDIVNYVLTLPHEGQSPASSGTAPAPHVTQR